MNRWVLKITLAIFPPPQKLEILYKDVSGLAMLCSGLNSKNSPIHV